MLRHSVKTRQYERANNFCLIKNVWASLPALDVRLEVFVVSQKLLVLGNLKSENAGYKTFQLERKIGLWVAAGD